MTNNKEGKGLYAPMLNKAAVNALICGKSDSIDIDGVTGQATVNKGFLTVTADKYKKPSVSAWKLLDMLFIKLTACGSYKPGAANVVSFTLDEYMELCGINNTKPLKDKTRNKIKKDLDYLFSLSLSWEAPGGKDFYDVRLCTSKGINKGVVSVEFTPQIAEYIYGKRLYIQYPLGLLKTDERNGKAYFIGRKLLLHASNKRNKEIGTANRISVKSLLNACPDIPSYEVVIQSNERHVTKRIKKPLQSALNALDFVAEYGFYTRSGRKCAEEEIISMDFFDFCELIIRFKLKED